MVTKITYPRLLRMWKRRRRMRKPRGEMVRCESRTTHTLPERKSIMKFDRAPEEPERREVVVEADAE